MSSTTVQEAVMAAREAHEALLNLKILAERAAHQIRTAEHRAIGLAVANPPKESALGTLRAAAASVPSSEIETAVAEVREKTERVLRVGS